MFRTQRNPYCFDESVLTWGGAVLFVAEMLGRWERVASFFGDGFENQDESSGAGGLGGRDELEPGAVATGSCVESVGHSIHRPPGRYRSRF